MSGTAFLMIQFVFAVMCISGGNTGYVEQFRQFGKRAVNVRVDVREFRPISIAELIKLADG
jgi:calcineurin-like phosphoesterase family protein